MSLLPSTITLALDRTVVREFWQFVHARHEVWRKRSILPGQPPWTDDPILQTVFFTNVYRELDKGTHYYIWNVVGFVSPEVDIFETLVYRQFNNVRTYKFMTDWRSFGDWENWEKIARLLTEYGQENNTNIFTDAHMTTGIKWGGFDDKARNVCWMLHEHWKNRKEIAHAIMGAPTLKERHKVVSALQGYGPFLAYEVVTDLGYFAHLNPKGFTEDDWANPGPGCRRAIDLLIAPAKRRELGFEYEDVIQALRTFQKLYFLSLEIDFNFYQGKELTLRNIEHSLCEFYKYYRAKYTGKARRKYRFGGRQ